MESVFRFIATNGAGRIDIKLTEFGTICLKDVCSCSCEILNNYFSSVFTKENLTQIPDKGNTSAYPTMETFTVTTPGVEKLLTELNPSKAAGPDGLPSRVLRLLAP